MSNKKQGTKNKAVTKKTIGKEGIISIKATGSNLDILMDKDSGKDLEYVQKSLFGVANDEVFNHLLNQVASGVGLEHDASLNVAIPALLNIAPRDSLEGMLAVQMIATHSMAMRMSALAMLSDQTPEGVEINTSRAAKLMRTYAGQMEALQKYRNKGQQTIQVQHVTVNDGGQAIVGSVSKGEG